MLSGNELLQLVVGSILAFVGVATLGLAVNRAQVRGSGPGWFGVFTALYGIRLVARIPAAAEALGLSRFVAEFIGNGITYIILAPAVAAGAVLLDRRNSLMLALFVADVFYGVLAISVDVVRSRAGSMMWANPIAVGANFSILLVILVPAVRGVHLTRGGAAALSGLAVFMLLAGYETAVGASRLRPHVSLEPLGMIAFIAGLGYLIAERVLTSERRLVVVSQELETARRIQRSILPAGTPRIPGLTVAARLVPMSAVAGDFYDFVTAPAGGLGVFVADVSGHGVPAAIIASMVKIALASEVDHARDPASLVARVNRTLCGKFEMAYVTAVYAWLDPESGLLTYASAGHPPPLVRRANGDLCRLDQHDLVLGFEPTASYTSAQVLIGPGDLILFYTDGIVEVEGPTGQFFGDRRLEECVRGWSGAGVGALIDDLLAALRAWKPTAHGEFPDDLTLVAVQVTERQTSVV